MKKFILLSFLVVASGLIVMSANAYAGIGHTISLGKGHTSHGNGNGYGHYKGGPSGAPEPQMIYLIGMAGLASLVYLSRKRRASMQRGA
ncbi:MAG: hypothetical protein H6757_06715 [Candidatus Omnitrophica bacterium]|nr:hypothetical protein [Candidatus Omnitrophota bacterium]